MAAIMYQTMSTDPEPVTKFNAEVDEATLSILNRALEKDKHRRYASAAHMAAELRALAQGWK